MKPFPFFFALLAVSCASKLPPIVEVKPSVGRPLTDVEADRVRLPETIKAYPLGRYADPRHRGVMHEAHTIYRVETTPKWNLAGQGRNIPQVPATAGGGKFSESELRVELGRQREATQTVMQSGQTVATKLTELAKSLQQNQQTLAEQNAGICNELQATRARLEKLEKGGAEAPASSSQARPPSSEEPW